MTPGDLPWHWSWLVPESVIVTHLTETIRANVADLLTRQDVRGLLDALKEHNAAVVEEVVPELLSVGLPDPSFCGAHPAYLPTRLMQSTRNGTIAALSGPNRETIAVGLRDRRGDPVRRGVHESGHSAKW